MNNLPYFEPLLPFIIIIGALILTGMIFYTLEAIRFIPGIPDDIIKEILFAMGTIWFGVMFVFMLMTVTCQKIYPTERFMDSGSEAASLNNLETEVCKQLQAVCSFKQGALGQAGIDNPSLLVNAIHTMIQGAGGTITECSDPTPSTQQAGTIPPLVPTGIPVSDDMFFSNPDMIQDRVDRAMRTLTGVIEPVASSTFASMNTCDGFESGGTGSDGVQIALVSSIANAQSVAATIRSRYLDPIQQKQEDLKAGHLSDCDKKKGASYSLQVGT